MLAKAAVIAWAGIVSLLAYAVIFPEIS